FKYIAVENGIFLERLRAPPNQRTGPIAVAERAIIHGRSRHTLLVFIGEERFGARDAAIGELPAPIFPRLDRQPGRPRIDFPLADIPAIFIWFASMKTGSFDSSDAIGHARS